MNNFEKAKTLHIQAIERLLHLPKEIKKSPFAYSFAKYRPALEKLSKS